MLLIQFKFGVFLKHVLMLHYAGPKGLKIATGLRKKLFLTLELCKIG